MSSEATTFIVDVSPSMVINNSVFKAMAYLEYTLLEKVKKGRKTDYISFYLSNCSVTQNSQSIPNVYQLQNVLAPVTLKDTTRILRSIMDINSSVSNNFNYNGETEDISSMLQCLLVTSLDINEYFKKRKILRQIVVFTDDIDGLDLNDEEMAVLAGELEGGIIFVDCREEKKETLHKSKWGQLLNLIPESSAFDINDFLKEISIPKPNIVKPVRIFAGELRLGADIMDNIVPSDFHRKSDTVDNNSIKIKVEGYPATKEVSKLSRKTVIKIKNGQNDDAESYYVPTKSVIEYEIKSEDNLKEEDGKREPLVSVSAFSVTKAYRYGTDYVVLPASIDEKRSYKTLAGLDIRGFVDENRLPRYMLNSESKVIFADSRQGCAADIVSLSALVDVLLENGKVAIARYVQKDNSDVEMCVLCPLLFDEDPSTDSKTEKIRVLILSKLPFAEDERVSDFPMLSQRRSTSGKPIYSKQAKDTEIDSKMSKFIDAMDIDGIPSVPDSEYYTSIRAESTSTVLTLPNENTSETRNNDPLLIPSANIHSQKQVLLEWIHQKVINKSDVFEIPVIADSLLSKITAHVMSEEEKRNVKELQDMLQIKKVIKREATETPTGATDIVTAEFVPSLTELLARGERD